MPNIARIRRTGQEGFSLAEIVIVMLIMGILASMAVPRIQTWVYNSANQGALNSLAGDLNLARMRAIRTARRTTLTIAPDGKSYVVVVDPNSAAPQTLKTVQLTRDYPALELKPHGAVITFDSRGMSTSSTTTTVTAEKGTRTSTLSISGVGRIYRAY